MPPIPKTKKQALKVKPGPLWKGPEDDGALGGITFSMLSRFLTCRERFRVRYLEGIRPIPKFDHKIEYGNMWHVCEEAHAAFGDEIEPGPSGGEVWDQPLSEYVKPLLKKYPLQRDEIAKWYNVCRIQFPIYVEHWRKHPDVKNRTPLLQEQVFHVPYKLPSNRTVWLKGKYDSVDLIKKPKDHGIWIQENKTKGEVDEQALVRQLTFDLQTMLYRVSLEEWIHEHASDDPGTAEAFYAPIAGVRYNVVKRPLSGGAGNIKQHKPSKSKPQGESLQEYYARLGEVLRENANDHYLRLQVPISSADVQLFRDVCLDPLLEFLCDWYDQQTMTQITYRDKRNLMNTVSGYTTPLTWRHPFGVANSIDEWGYSDLDSYLESGSMVGLERVTTMFEELQ